MNINKTIHEAMGLCWHEKIKTTKGEHRTCNCCDPYDYHHECPDCEFFSITDDTVVEMFAFDDDERPDYTDPVHYCALMDWLREEHNNSYKFKMWLTSTKDISMLYHWWQLPRQEQITLIADASESGVFS